MPLVDIVNR